MAWSWVGALQFIRPPVVCIKPGGGVILWPTPLGWVVEHITKTVGPGLEWTISGTLISTATFPPFTIVTASIAGPEVDVIGYSGGSPFVIGLQFTTASLDHYCQYNLTKAGKLYTTAYFRLPSVPF